ncbi:MAG: helix-turn-helix transcriptional regulator [Ferruginibacter sp.]
MDMLEVIRHKTGLSQYKMAEYLCVSRSSIKMAEKGLRKLPHEAEMRAIALFHTINQNEQKANNQKETAPSSESKTKKISKLAGEHSRKMKDFQFKAMVLKRKLEKIKKRNLQVITRQEMVTALKENFPFIKKKGIDDSWLAYQEVIIEEYNSTSDNDEEGLQGEIEVLLAYAAAHEIQWKKYTSKFEDLII